MKEQWKDHDKRIGAIESATAISQTNNMKLAVIDERLKTYDVRMDRIERKIDGIAESQNSVGQQAQMNKLEIENIKLKIEKRS